ncbi:hypothetical protein C8R34_101142 [Nitrosomonas sp. Nm84]|uniref:hypothetical protein n=1 Tax=Nitrosomonas sp. Nm84 TaxID=200124 RepID=UPI000D755411|nr:hypothetical protein [Nitrosomonas sp. Nm84]PXW91233.1 hypothetical protein C8R34_101142 [Nitrosomonas sp. Nm84]
MIKKIVKAFCLSVALAGLLSACSSTQKVTNSARTATEQLLITEAAMRSLPKQRDLPFPIPRGATVKLDVTGVSGDKDVMKGIVGGWLGLNGYNVQDENASHRVNIIVNSLGTELSTTFFGLPPISASLIPIALPELAFYKSENQSGYARFHFDIFELPSGRFLASSSPFVAGTFYNAYTVLFLFTFNKTDLASPPQVGKFKDMLK